MATAINRRALLRGRFASSAPVIRPPWAATEEQFLTLCSRCDDCSKACPESIIQRGDGGFPEIHFKHGECTFCGDCVQACQPQALSHQAFKQQAQPWQLAPSLKNKCLALNKVVCRSCAEQCEQRAIHFRPALGGVSHPEIDSALCNGCGACIGPCPVAAISLQPNPSSGTTGESQQETNR